MYAIIKTGGKQYRVEEGQSLLVERLRGDDGDKLTLQPLLFVDGSTVVDGGDELGRVKVEARVVAHERGPKLRVVKFKPKRGYKRRTGHRQELTRIEVTSLKLGARRRSGSAPGAGGGSGSGPAEGSGSASGARSGSGSAGAEAESKESAKPARARSAGGGRSRAGAKGKPPAAKDKPSAAKDKPAKEEKDGA